MRKGIYFILILFILFFPLVVSAGTYEEELQGLSLKIAKNIERSGKRTVAVVDFTDFQGNVTELGRFIAEELSANLVSLKKGFRVIDRLHLKSIIAEHKLSASWFLSFQKIQNHNEDCIGLPASRPSKDANMLDLFVFPQPKGVKPLLLFFALFLIVFYDISFLEEIPWEKE